LAREVKYPCKDGFKEIYSFDMIGEHRKKCQYIPQPCPVDKLDLENCTWTGIRSSMTSHPKHAHSDMCEEYDDFSNGEMRFMTGVSGRLL
jgi:hypothetical protein